MTVMNRHATSNRWRENATGGVTNPWVALLFGYTVLGFFIVVMYILGFYSSSSFFRIGVPVTILNVTITEAWKFHLLLSTFFLHQLSNTWVSEVVYPWIINNVQDRKVGVLDMNRFHALLLVNLNTIYSILDIVFIVTSVSQISFLFVLVLSNVISVSIVNWSYLKEKETNDENSSVYLLDVDVNESWA